MFMDTTLSSPVPNNALRTSEILLHFITSASTERVSFNDMKNALGARAFGILLLLFTIPSFIPGTNGIFGLPLMLLSWQLMFKRQEIWLPGWLGRRSLPKDALKKAIEDAGPILRRLERILKPRKAWAVNGRGECILGIVGVVMSIVLILPIPLGNWLPSLSIGLMALGLAEKDGLSVLAGHFMAVVALIVSAASVWVIAKAILYFIGKFFRWI
jgi:hypothetical protein